MTKFFKKLFGKDTSKNLNKSEGFKGISQKEAQTIEKAVKRTVNEYGEALKRLGND